MRGVVLIASIIAATVATNCTRAIWGYGFMRPSIHRAAWNVNGVDAFTDVMCNRISREWKCTPTKQPVVAETVAFCQRDSYYCLSERLVVALSEQRLIHDGLPQPSASDMRQLSSALSSPGLIAPAERGYTGDRVLGGTLVVGRTSDRKRLLVVGLGGPEISNDHHAYYELLLDADTGQIVESRLFYWDLAGAEALEPFWWFGVFTLTVVPIMLAFRLARRVCAGRSCWLGLRRSGSQTPRQFHTSC